MKTKSVNNLPNFDPDIFLQAAEHIGVQTYYSCNAIKLVCERVNDYPIDALYFYQNLFGINEKYNETFLTKLTLEEQEKIDVWTQLDEIRKLALCFAYWVAIDEVKTNKVNTNNDKVQTALKMVSKSRPRMNGYDKSQRAELERSARKMIKGGK